MAKAIGSQDVNILIRSLQMYFAIPQQLIYFDSVFEHGTEPI